MSVRKIYKKRFYSPINFKNEPEAIKKCPFLDNCKCRIQKTIECRYDETGLIPIKCPLRCGSITEIYYIDNERNNEN